MEDAHVALHDLFSTAEEARSGAAPSASSHSAGAAEGGGRIPLAFFAVFDGHGGQEVAEFCRLHMPSELRRLLRPSAAAGAAPEELGGALRAAFLAMDDLLRKRAGEAEVQALREAADAGGRRRAGGAAPDERHAAALAPRLEAQIVERLRATVERDLADALQERGALGDRERLDAIAKLSLLKRAQGVGAGAGRLADQVGCAAICVLVGEAGLVCAGAGDSRAVLCRAGRAMDLSKDHKPADEGERQRIVAAGGRVESIPSGSRVQHRVNGNLNLSRAIGDLAFKGQRDLGPDRQVITACPDVTPMPLTPDDEFIVLACDGVWDTKSSQAVCDFVRQRIEAGEDSEAIVEALLDDCLAEDPKKAQGLGGDNMTCILVRLR